MKFCQKCGRQRAGNARFCAGCGTEFPAPEADPAAPEANRAAPEALQPEATRVDVRPDVTRIDPPGASPRAAQPDPFASWFAPGAAPAGQPAPPQAETPPQWQQGPTETVFAAHAYPPPGYPQPSAPAPAFPPVPPGYRTEPPRPSGGKKAAFIIAAVLIVLAAGGGAYALVSRSTGHTTAQPPARTAGSATVKPTGSAKRAASPSGSASATAGSSASASATATQVPNLVAAAPGLASTPAEPQVSALLSRYFYGINTHDYSMYASALDPRQKAAQPESQFKSGYATTTDSGMTLTSLAGTGNGGLAATVTFTSHQSRADSVDNSPCNNWRLAFYLVPHGSGYLIGPAPSGAPQPSYSDC